MARRYFIWAAIVVLALDQATKIAVYGLVEPGTPLNLIGDFLRVWHTGNERGIFGISFGPKMLHVALQVAGSILVVVLGVRNRDRVAGLAYGMILGGAVGNLADRVRIGRVIDFIDMGLRNWRWYTYNIADMGIVLGIILLLAREFLFRPKPAEPAAQPAPPVPEIDNRQP